MVRWSSGLICLSAILLAGCVGAADDAGAPDSDALVAAEDAAGPTMVQHGCQSFYSRHKVDLAYAESRLPDGLRPYPWSGGALFTVKSWTCPGSTLDNASIASGAALVYYIAVSPEPEYTSEDVGFSWYPLEIITETPELADVFASWGFTVAAPGKVSIARSPDAPPQVITVAAEGQSRLDEQVTLTGAGRTATPFTVRYFAGDGERVLGAVDIVVHPGLSGGGTPTTLRMTGPHAPSAAPLIGDSGYQGWAGKELSYTWTPVTFK